MWHLLRPPGLPSCSENHPRWRSSAGWRADHQRRCSGLGGQTEHNPAGLSKLALDDLSPRPSLAELSRPSLRLKIQLSRTVFTSVCKVTNSEYCCITLKWLQNVCLWHWVYFMLASEEWSDSSADKKVTQGQKPTSIPTRAGSRHITWPATAYLT